MAPDGDDRLRLDYDQTTQLLRTLTDIRFKLIAFVPTIAAASVGFFGKPRPAVELLAIGLLGMTMAPRDDLKPTAGPDRPSGSTDVSP